MKDCNVHVYERKGQRRSIQYERKYAIDRPVNPDQKTIIRVLYCGSNHYGELIVCSAAAAAVKYRIIIVLVVMSGTDAIKILQEKGRRTI
jgi:hypothetical protein